MTTQTEANDLIAEQKVILANLDWQADGRTYRLKAAVFALTSNRVLRLQGYIGPKNRSLALLYRNDAIRKWTVHDRHRNPITGQLVREPHKHTWHDDYEDAVIYVPKDIRLGDPNEELEDFLKECNITMKGSYKPRSFF